MDEQQRLPKRKPDVDAMGHALMATSLKSAARRLARRFGYDVVRTGAPSPVSYPADFDEAAIALVERVRPFTLTGPERIVALRDATRYVVDAGIPGGFVECGVWRGGSMQVVALTLLERGCHDRDLYLYDTFGYIPPPRDGELDIHGRSALADWKVYAERGMDAAPEYLHPLPFDQVRTALLETGYPEERIHWVKGDVRDTIPAVAPDQIAVLRLDTDYYESTIHELQHLEPRVSDGGVVLVDDYGHFSGARDATDEYFAEQGKSVLLQRVDYTARMVLVRRSAGLDVSSAPATSTRSEGD